MTRPGGDFEYTDDSVQAHLSVDVPNESLAAIAQIAEKTAEMRTHMEAAARAQGDFAEYLRTLPQLLEQTAAAGERFAESVIVRPGADVAGSAHDPFGRGYRPGEGPVVSAAEASREQDRIQRDRERAAAAAPAPTEDEIARDLETLEREDPRQAANMRTQRERATAPGRPPAPARPGSNRPRNRPDAPDNSTDNPETPDRETPSTDWAARFQGISGSTQGLVQQVLAETRPGGSPLASAAGIAGIVGSQARTLGPRLNAYADRQQAIVDEIAANPDAAQDQVTRAGHAARLAGLARFAGGNLGTIARGAGLAGAAIGLTQASQNVGEQYQQYKATGLIRGGGAAEGFAFEAGIRMMALNPFLTTEQSRQIMMNALSQGYTGKEFDSMTEFMAENLKDLNISAAESAKIVQQQVIQGGQSMTSLGADLETMRGLSERGYLTFDQLREQATGLANQAIQQGAGGETAMEYGMLSTQLWSDDKLMAPVGEAFGSAALNNAPFRQAIANQLGLQGVPNPMIPAALQEEFTPEQQQQAGLEVIQARLLPLARQYANGTVQQKSIALQTAMNTLRGWGMNLSPQQVADMLRQVGEGELVNNANAASDAIAEEEQAIEDRNERASNPITGLNPGGTGTSFTGEVMRSAKAAPNLIGNTLAVAATGVGDLVEGIGGMFGIGDGNEGFESSRAALKELTTEHENTTARFANSRIQELVSQYGSGSIKVQREGGEEETLDQNNREQIEEVLSGKAQVRTGDSDWMSLEQLQANTNDSLGGGAGGNALGVDINVTAAPELRRYLNFDTTATRTPTQQGADQGRAGVSNNNPAPTEGLPWPIATGGR